MGACLQSGMRRLWFLAVLFCLWPFAAQAITRTPFSLAPEPPQKPSFSLRLERGVPRQESPSSLVVVRVWPDGRIGLFCGGDPINGFDSDGRCIEGAATAADNLIYGTANLANNALCTLSYAVASPFAPDWAYQTYGGNVQNFANTVTGTAQFGYNVAATATYGAISPFAPDFAYNNYGGNVQQFMGQAPALYGGDNQSTAYQIGYGTVTAAATLLGGEEGDAGNLGTVSGPITDSSVITDPARLLPAPVVPEAPVNVLPSSGSTFVVSPGGDIIVVPEGASGPVPNINPSGNTTGFGYTGGSGGPGLDSRVSSVRIMDPTLPAGPSPGYPAGYVNYMNASGQSVNPFTGQTIAPSNPLWHIPLTPP